MSDNNNQNTYIEEDEITLKELILKLQEFYREVVSHWKLVILITVPFVLFFLFRAFTTPATYPASLTFMVNEDEGGGIGGAMAILSQFGFGGGGGGGKYNLEKILQLSKTRKIVQSALFNKTTINDNHDYIANHLIDLYDYHEAWEESEIGLKNFKFTHVEIDRFNLTENAALKTLHSKVIGGENVEGIFSTGINEEAGIMNFKVNSESPDFSISLVNNLYNHLDTFYTEKTIEKQQSTYDLVREKVDSIQNELNAKEGRLAKLKDSSRNIYTNTDNLRESRLGRDVQVLSIMYGEALKNLEIADFSLKNKTPFIQLIDAPIPPINPIGESKLKAIILGGFLGGFLAIGFIIGRKIFRDAMSEK